MNKELNAKSEPMIGQGCRQSARGVLEDLFRRQEDKATPLGILLKVVPWALLSPEDEQILWTYFMSHR